MNRLGFFLMLLAGMVSAAFAQQRWSFTDVTELVDVPTRGASTVAWGDLNGDSYLDLFVGGAGDNPSHLYLNFNGEFMDVSELYGLRDYHTDHVREARWLDYNSDGLTDICLVTDNERGVQLLTQVARGGFTTTIIGNGVRYPEPVRAVAWTDVDADGSLDLILSNGPESAPFMTVFTQEQFEEFAEMRANPFEDRLDAVGAISIVDFDQDGDMDIFMGLSRVSGEGLPHFYRNVGNGEYEDWSERFGMDRKLGDYGATWLDYNNDQKLDLFLPGDERSTALFRGGRVHYADGLTLAQVPGLIPAAVNSRWAHAVDANLDGWTDLFIVRENDLGCALMVNNRGESWTDYAMSLRIDNIGRENTACAWGDYDNDGDLDLAIAQGENGIKLYRNQTPGRQFVTLNLVTRAPHTMVLGTRVNVSFDQCKQMGSTPFTTCAAGGDDSRIVLVNRAPEKSDAMDLTITWPNGVERRYTADEVPMGRVTTLYQPTAPADPVAMIEHPQGPANPLIGHSISPNPFNPTTTISFTLAADADVRLDVYNLVGQLVTTLANGPYAEGTHRVSFQGAGLPSGLYFTRLTAGSNTVMSRMLLAK